MATAAPIAARPPIEPLPASGRRVLVSVAFTRMLPVVLALYPAVTLALVPIRASVPPTRPPAAMV